MKKPNSLAKVLNKSLTPVEKSYRILKTTFVKTRDKFPSFYEYFENSLGHQIVSVKDLIRSEKKSVGNIITSNVMKRLPHIEESQINELLEKPSNKGFLDTLTKGLGINKDKEKTYTVLRKRGFKRVLIANRGEIALRIIRALRELEIESVVIYSEEEKGALSIKFADKAYNIGKSKNYLDLKKMVKLAKKAGCDAIHPGYGFLSENSDFAKLCEKQKIKFIGPSSKMIKSLGDKIEAKKAMKAADVPVIEGIREDLKSAEQAIEVAKRVGFPVIIKAAAGGGGKGMRIIRKEKEVAPSFESAKKEAANAFGDDSVYIEKYIEDPRHIEFQILADKHGNVIHLGERDCSIQRKHQKLVEEAPSPALTEEMREKMGSAAVRAIKAIGYEGAGTAEFLLDKSNDFYFIEMNTRIQVEHGVTEFITNVDLVKEQIKLAEGAKLAFEQKDIKIEGHAIECRINAEDPTEDFSPSTGTITQFLPPGGPGIRISSPCHAGYTISPNFDSLIALLICYGSTREEAIARMNRSLDEFLVEGVKSTMPFHKVVLSNKQFLKGKITTSFIPKNKIMETLKSLKSKKETLTKEEKIIVVSTAVTKYMEKKKEANNKSSNWMNAARQDSMQEAVEERSF